MADRPSIEQIAFLRRMLVERGAKYWGDALADARDLFAELDRVTAERDAAQAAVARVEALRSQYRKMKPTDQVYVNTIEAYLAVALASPSRDDTEPQPEPSCAVCLGAMDYRHVTPQLQAEHDRHSAVTASPQIQYWREIEPGAGQFIPSNKDDATHTRLAYPEHFGAFVPVSPQDAGTPAYVTMETRDCRLPSGKRGQQWLRALITR